jgi:hypothetical protein
MVDLKNRLPVNEFSRAAGPVGMAEGQVASVLVAFQFAAQAMLEMVNASDQLTPEAVEYFLTLKRLRETIDEELREIDAALELAEQKVSWT